MGAAARMAAAPLGARGAIPARTLGLLIAIIFIAHYGLLTLAPASFGTQTSALTRTFSTRSVRIEAPGVPPMPNKAVAAASRAVLKPKVPDARANSTSNAINLVANEPPPEAATAPISSTAPLSTAAAQPASAAAPAPEPTGEATARATRELERPRSLGPLLIPGSARLRYTLTGQTGAQPLAGASSELLWLHDGKDYNARLVVSALFATLRTNTSVGSIGSEGLAPTRFSDKTRTEVAAHFEREKGKVVFSANTPDAPLLSGAQDRLSIVMQLAALLAGDPARYPAASTLTVQTVGPREADTWLFSVEGQEPLALPYGNVQALKLTRNPRREYDQKVEFWFAPTLGWLPVRMKLTESNGNFIDQQLRASDKP